MAETTKAQIHVLKTTLWPTLATLSPEDRRSAPPSIPLAAVTRVAGPAGTCGVRGVMLHPVLDGVSRWGQSMGSVDGVSPGNRALTNRWGQSR